MASCLIGLGSNLGDRQRNLDEAVQRLAGHPQVTVLRRSRWWPTAPVGGPAGQRPFLNGVVVAETSLAPEAFWQLLRRAEAAAGRRRSVAWGPRQLDLDLLLYDRLVLETPHLQVPHPSMAWRRFVLHPALEVAPDWVHPTTGWTISQLVRHLDTAAPYVAIAGPACCGKTQLAGILARRTEGLPIRDSASGARIGSPAGSSGSLLAVELELLAWRAELLHPLAACWADPGRLKISDFWFDQGLAYAGVRLGVEDFRRFRQRWETDRRRVVQPKLTVMLDPAPGRGRRGDRERAGAAGGVDFVGAALRRLVTSPGHGPVLRADGPTLAAVADRVLAALEASRPHTLL